MDFRKPDYDNGIVNLMAFLAQGMAEQSGEGRAASKSVSQPQASTRRPRNPVGIPTLLQSHDYQQALAAARHVFLVVLDGLGYHYLRAQAESFLLRFLVGNMTSVFPSSTAPAVCSFLSGSTPAMHGVFGWHQWVQSIGQVCRCLPFESRATGTPLGEWGVAITDCFAFPSFFERLERPSFAYSPEAITCSPFNTYATRGASAVGYADWQDLISKVKKTTQSAPGKTYQYIYWPYFDSSCHKHGMDSAETADIFRMTDHNVQQLVQALSAGGQVGGESNGERLVIVTSDHGMIDTKPADRLVLADFPAVADRLMMPLCGEPRAVYCHVKARARPEFPQVVAGEMGGYCECIPVDALIEEGWFGPGFSAVPAHHYDALGDYALMMKSHYTVQDALPGEAGRAFIGMHGGATAAEMETPLCWICC